MFCTQCGAQLSDSARFCSVCGKAAGMTPVVETVYDDAPGKKLRRIAAGKKIAGVCAGFADYFEIDVSLMRVIWVALLLLPPGIGLIAYVVAWVVLPIG
jgi:phage shock protein C